MAKAIHVAHSHTKAFVFKTVLVQELTAFLASNRPRPRDLLPIADLGSDRVDLDQFADIEDIDIYESTEMAREVRVGAEPDQA